MSEDRPFDAGKHAPLVMDAARDIAARILHERAALDASGQQDKTLVIVWGHSHNDALDYAARMRVTQNLVEAGETPHMAFESSHNNPRLTLSALKDLTPQMLKESARESNLLTEDEYLNAKFCSGSLQEPEDSDETNSALYSQPLERAFLINNKIPTFFNDTAFTDYDNFDELKETALDERDTSTRKAIEECLGQDHSGPVADCSVDGVHVRNHHMAMKISERIEANKTRPPRIIIQTCGAAHMIPCKDMSISAEGAEFDAVETLPPEYALPSIIKKIKSCAVLTIIPIGHKDELDLLELEPHEKYPPLTLPSVETSYGDMSRLNQSPLAAALLRSFDKDLKIEPYLTSIREEAAYMRELLSGIGMENTALSLAEISEMRKECLRKLRESFDDRMGAILDDELFFNFDGEPPEEDLPEHNLG